MTTAELNNSIDTILLYFEKDRQIEIKQFLPLVVKGFPLDEILNETEKRGLLKRINSLRGERIFELTEKGEIVLQMGGFVSYLNNDLEMTRLTRKNLKVAYWSTIGQFILAVFVAIATCISGYVAWNDYQEKQSEKFRNKKIETSGQDDSELKKNEELKSSNSQTDSLDSSRK